MKSFEGQRVLVLAVELPEGVGRTLSVDPTLFDQPVENYGMAKMKILPLPIPEGAPKPVDDSAHDISSSGIHLDL